MATRHLAYAALAAGAAALGAAAGPAQAGKFNQPGNILIADQFNNRVIEIDPLGEIVWQYGKGPQDVTSASPVGTNDAERIGGNTLISGTGAPPGTEPKCPAGCAETPSSATSSTTA